LRGGRLCCRRLRCSCFRRFFPRNGLSHDGVDDAVMASCNGVSLECRSCVHAHLVQGHRDAGRMESTLAVRTDAGTAELGAQGAALVQARHHVVPRAGQQGRLGRSGGGRLQRAAQERHALHPVRCDEQILRSLRLLHLHDREGSKAHGRAGTAGADPCAWWGLRMVRRRQQPAGLVRELHLAAYVAARRFHDRGLGGRRVQ
jgi:hypothetical protein